MGERSISLRERMFGTGESYQYWECSECGTLRISELPADMDRFYPFDYYSFAGPTKAAGLLGWSRQRLRKIRARYAATGHGLIGRALQHLRPDDRLGAIGRLRPALDTRILDVGSGDGDLLRQLSGVGFTRVEGVDPFISADIDLPGGVHIRKATIADMAGTFDIIAFNHSLEHSADPLSDLRHAARLLGDDGTVIVRMPVGGTFAWETYGKDWVQLDPPRHLEIISERGARKLAARAGFSVVSVRYDSTAMQFWGSEQARRDIPLRAPQSYYIDPARSPFTRAEIRRWARRSRELNRVGRGDQAAYYLRKSA